jgi:hypothetical protein
MWECGADAGGLVRAGEGTGRLMRGDAGWMRHGRIGVEIASCRKESQEDAHGCDAMRAGGRAAAATRQGEGWALAAEPSKGFGRQRQVLRLRLLLRLRLRVSAGGRHSLWRTGAVGHTFAGAMAWGEVVRLALTGCAELCAGGWTRHGTLATTRQEHLHGGIRLLG